MWSFGYSIHVGVGSHATRGRAETTGRESRRGGAARGYGIGGTDFALLTTLVLAPRCRIVSGFIRFTTRCLDVPRTTPAGASTCTPDRAPHTRRRRPVDGRPSASTTRRHHCRYHRTHMVQSHTVESSTCTRTTDTRRAVHSSRPPAPRVSPNLLHRCSFRYLARAGVRARARVGQG